MRKLLSLALALVMAMAIAVPAFASDEPLAVPAAAADTEDDGIMPLLDLYFKSDVDATDSLWVSNPFTATRGKGNYIRFWHLNDTDHAVTVYLYRTDSGSERLVSSMTVPANDQLSKVYYNGSAESGTYKIEIESSARHICGQVAVAQYLTRP